jgi:PhnB protein
MSPVPSVGGSGSFFAPHLTLKIVADAMAFYTNAFGAIELRRFSNDDGSVHVGEMEIGGALFHLHEEVPPKGELSPQTLGGTTCIIGLFVPDPDALFAQAIATGGREIHPMQDYDYGYRQGVLADPFGHIWLIQKRI